MKEDAGYRDFLRLCSNIRSMNELRLLFDLFLTIEEKEILGKRLLIVKELLENRMTQRKISKQRHVSIAQITRGSNALKIIDQNFKQFLKNHLK